MSSDVLLMTAEELLTLPGGEFRYELVNGELRKMALAGHEHGRITIQLSVPLAHFILNKRLGQVYAAGTGFKLESDPDTVRASDIAFVTRQRVEALSQASDYFPGAPDLAVEVLSPDDRVYEVENRVSDWLGAGSRQVWVVSPRLRTVTVYRSLTHIIALTERDSLEGGDVVPGFTIPVAEIFAE